MRTAQYLSGTHKFSRRLVGGAVALLLVANGAAWYQLEVRSKRAPSFSHGGAFAAAAGVAEVETTTSTTAAPASSITTAAPPPPPETTATTVIPAPANSYAPSRNAARSTGEPATPGGVLPALGTYTWKVTGTEGATGFGTRTLPPTATVVAHAGDAGQVVWDTTYSADHKERLIFGDQAGSLVATYEGGQVRFGPMAQTNSGTYSPAMAYVPRDRAAGAVAKGTTKVLDDSGNVQRTEAWTLTVVGRKVIPVMGRDTEVWELVLERQTTAGSGQQVHRVRREWWDANRRSVVRYTDTMHGQQHMGGITFTYDSDLTAELTGWKA